MQTLDDPVLSATGADDAEHLVCPCSPDIACCGAATNANDFDPEREWSEEDTCILCVAVAEQPCPRCGE